LYNFQYALLLIQIIIPYLIIAKQNAMSDDLTKRRLQDASKINIPEPHEIKWWCYASD
jgi:hypothetical protein